MRTRAGLALALAAAVISGVAVYVNSYAVRAWGTAVGGAAAYTTAKNLVAAVSLAIALAVATSRTRKEGLTLPHRPAYVGTWYAALARAGAIDVTALLVPGAIVTALLQSGSKALAPQWPGLALVAAGAALVLVAAARKNPGPALAGVR